MYYTRGPADDFDKYANLTGDQGWSWNSLQTYIQKVELSMTFLPCSTNFLTERTVARAHGPSDSQRPVRLALSQFYWNELRQPEQIRPYHGQPHDSNYERLSRGFPI